MSYLISLVNVISIPVLGSSKHFLKKNLLLLILKQPAKIHYFLIIHLQFMLNEQFKNILFKSLVIFP